MIVEPGVNLDTSYSWLSTVVRGPYDIVAKTKVYVRPFTYRESNYFETLVNSGSPTRDKFFFVVSNCILPEVDFDKATVGFLNTVYNLCLYYSGWNHDPIFKFNGAKTIEEKASEWSNSHRGAEQTLCVALLEGCTFKQLDNVDQLEYIKLIQAMQARYRAVYGDERFEWFMKNYYGVGGSSNAGFEVSEQFYADPGSKTQAGYEAVQTTIRSKSAPTKTVKEVQEQIREGKILIPKIPSIPAMGNAI